MLYSLHADPGLKLTLDCGPVSVPQVLSWTNLYHLPHTWSPEPCPLHQCMECALQLETCPLCRQDIQTRVRLIAHVSWQTSCPFSNTERHTSPTASSSSSNPLSPSGAVRTVPQCCDDTRTVTSGKRRRRWRGEEKKKRRWEEGNLNQSWIPRSFLPFTSISSFVSFWQLTADTGPRIVNFLPTVCTSDKKSRSEEHKQFNEITDRNQPLICKPLCSYQTSFLWYEDPTALSA